MAGEGGDAGEEAAIEEQLEHHLSEQQESLAAVDEALASDPSNIELLAVHEELLSAIKDAEEGLLHLKRSRLLREADAIFSGHEPDSLVPGEAAERQVKQDHSELESYPVGSRCRFRHIDGRWYNGQSLVGSTILADSGVQSGIWRKAELESWNDKLGLGRVVFQDDGSSAELGPDAISINEYADMSDNDEDGELSSGASDSSEDEEDTENGTGHQGLGFMDASKLLRGVQTETIVFAKWENHTRGIASKMMASMGYHGGMGLGISGQGITDPVSVKVHRGKQSLDHALASNKAEENSSGRSKITTRGGKRKREKKFAEAARAAKSANNEEEETKDVFSFINNQLAGNDAMNVSGNKQRKGSGERERAKKEDRRSLVAYDDEARDLRNRVEKLEEMVNRNRKDKAMYEAASRKLNETRKALADAEAAHASASDAVVSKEKEKKWLKF